MLKSKSWIAPLLMLITALLPSCGPQDSVTADLHAMKTRLLLDGPAISVGGLGVVGENLHVNVESPNNELLIRGAIDWIGRSRNKNEVVLFYKNTVLPKAQIPAGFKATDCILISFEKDRVVFIKYPETTGSCYTRF